MSLTEVELDSLLTYEFPVRNNLIYLNFRGVVVTPLNLSLMNTYILARRTTWNGQNMPINFTPILLFLLMLHRQMRLPC